MASSMALQYNTTGFYKTPVSKGLIGCMFLTSCALNVPLLAHLKKSFSWTYWDIFGKGEVWRLVTSKTTFLETKDLICGSLLIYYFRIFERRYGSKKYASCLLATTVVTTMLELLVCYALHYFNLDDSISYQYGSYGFIFPMFISYFFDIPRVAHTMVLGVPVTGKTLTYLLGLQMLSCSKQSALSGLCGFIAGFMYRFNVFKIQSLVRVPNCLSRTTNFLFSWLLKSSPPRDNAVPMGATLDIQRQLRVEQLEQQMMLNHAREMRNMANHHDQHYFVPDLGSAAQLFEGVNNNDYISQDGVRHRGGGAHSRSTGVVNENRLDPGPSVKEEQVQQLVEMGFERQSVLAALRTSNYDMNVATNMLLQDS